MGRSIAAAKRAWKDLLRDLRHRMGDVSQEELARRVGVSWSTVNRWENGRGKPSPLAREKILHLARAAGMPASTPQLKESL